MPIFFGFMSPLEWVLVIASMLITMWAQMKVKGAYARYSRVATRGGMTGADVARGMMYQENIGDVGLELVAGEMTDHYDPIKKVVRLSEGVYHGSSVAALGIAAHEVGHVIQHARGYAPLQLRHAIYPVAGFGGKLAWPLIMAGIFLPYLLPTTFALSGILLKAGIWLFAATVVFTFITLPVEFNASKRALQALSGGGTMTADELRGAKKVLDAAALTYVAAAAAAVLMLIRLLLILNRRD